MTDETPELDGMPPKPPPVPKVYLSGTPMAPTDSILTDVTEEDLGRKVVIVINAVITKEGGQTQKQGTVPFVNVNAQTIESIDWAIE